MDTPSHKRPSYSERLYSCLLWLYPTRFREKYGHEMLQTFRDYYREEQRQRNPWWLGKLWSIMLNDLLSSVSLEHWKASLNTLQTLFGLEKEPFMIQITFAAQTDIGKRNNNEDNMSMHVPEDQQEMEQKGALFVVADGMGGHAKGEVASELAVTEIQNAYYQDSDQDIGAALKHAVERANKIIYGKNEELQLLGETEHKKGQSMGTTCVAAVLRGDRVYVANAGDSLAYVIRTGEITQIAQNHDMFAEQVRKGEMSEEEAKKRGPSAVITRCLGVDPEVEIYLTSAPVQNGDVLVLCTDGLWALIEEEELRSIAEQHDPEESAQQLIKRANENGGPDNITAVVIQVALAA